MTCEQARDRIHDRLDGLLSDDGAKRLDRHLESCESCRTLFEQLNRLDRGLAALRSLSDLPDLDRQPPIRMRSAPRGVRVWRAAAALALVIGAGFAAMSWMNRTGEKSGAEFVEAPATETVRAPTIALGEKSAEMYVAVMQDTDQPDVHIVWLHRTVGTPRERTIGPSSRGSKVKDGSSMATAETVGPVGPARPVA